MKEKDLFPKYHKSRLKGELGVSVMKSVVEEELNWIFRRNYQEHDFGIDGYIDLITDIGQVTGKSIAIQIKYGSSFFKESDEIGWIYRGEKKHLNYFMNIEIPVLICLINPDTKKIYWTLFQFEETNQAGENWKIIVPFEQELNKKSKLQLTKFTGIATDYISQFEHYWKINQKLEEAGLLLIIIGRDDIEKRNTKDFIKLFKRLEVNKKLIQSMRNKVNFLVHGYEDDLREVYQIPEVRIWMKEILEKIDSWGYFLNMEDELSGLFILHLCTREINVLGKYGEKYKIDFSPEELEKTLDVIFLKLNLFCELHKISEIINREQSLKIVECLVQEKMKK